MALIVGCITFDSLDPRSLAAWWAGATGGEVVSDMDGFYVSVKLPSDQAPMLAFQKVPDPTPGKNRLHLELMSTESREAEAGRLVSLGAKVVYEGDIGGFGWTTLADPDGNLFCVGDPMGEE